MYNNSTVPKPTSKDYATHPKEAYVKRATNKTLQRGTNAIIYGDASYSGTHIKRLQNAFKGCSRQESFKSHIKTWNECNYISLYGQRVNMCCVSSLRTLNALIRNPSCVCVCVNGYYKFLLLFVSLLYII